MTVLTEQEIVALKRIAADFGLAAPQVAGLRKLGTGLLDAAQGIHGSQGGAYKVLYTDVNGVVQEVALGASGTVLQSAGASSAPAFSTVLMSELGAGGTWKMLYSNGSGVWTELALGADGTVLKGEGASSAPTFGAVTLAELTGGNWKMLYTNGSGAGTELALGAAGTYLAGNGTGSAPTFTTLPSTFTAKHTTADRTRANDTLTADDDLVVSVAASTNYAFVFGLLYTNASATPDIKIGFTCPASQTLLSWGSIGPDTNTTDPTSATTIRSAYLAADGSGGGTGRAHGTSALGPAYLWGSGVLRNGTNAGSLTLVWAQNSTDAGNVTTLKAGSHLILYPTS